MPPHLHYEIVRLRQEEIAARAIESQRVQGVRAVAGRRSGWGARRAIAALGVCAAASSFVAIDNASAHPRAAEQQPGRVSGAQLQHELNALKTVGFVATSCEVGGMRLTNYSTGQSVLLSLSPARRSSR
jgi:hypothetical protein